MQLSDPSNPIWFSEKENGTSHASPLLGRGEEHEHKVGQTFVFPFTGDEICMLRLTLLQETQFGGDIELASGKIDLNVLPFDSTLSPWIDMTVRDTAVKGKAKNCAVKLAVTWLNLKGKQYKRRSLAVPTKNTGEQLSLLVSVTDAADLPRLAYGRKPLAHVDVSVGKQKYHLGKDVTSHTAAPKPSCEPHWLRSGLRCSFHFNLNSVDDILSLQVHAEGPNQPLESHAIENIETMIGLANIPAYEPRFLNVGVQSSHPIRGIRPGGNPGSINIFRCVIDRAFFAELRHGRYLELKSILRQQFASKGDFLTKLTNEMASISRRRLHWDKLEVSEAMATASVASLPNWNMRSVNVVSPEASFRVVKGTKSCVKLIRAQERIVVGVLEKMPRDNPRNVGEVDSVYSKTELEALPINHKRAYLESRIKSLMDMDAKLASSAESDRLIDSVQQLPILDKPPWKEDTRTITMNQSLSLAASSRMQRHLNGSQVALECIDAVGNNALSLLVNIARERGLADTLALARQAKFLQRDQPMHKFHTFISEMNSPFWQDKIGLHLGHVTLSIVKHTNERLVVRILTCNVKLSKEQRSQKQLKIKVEYNGAFAQKVVKVRSTRSFAISGASEVQLECKKLGFILMSSDNKTKLRNLLSQQYLLVSVWCQALDPEESPWECIGQSQMQMTIPSSQKLDGNKVLMLVKTCDTSDAVEQLQRQTEQLEKSVQRSRQHVDILSSSRELLEHRLMADLGKKSSGFQQTKTRQRKRPR